MTQLRQPLEARDVLRAVLAVDSINQDREDNGQTKKVGIRDQGFNVAWNNNRQRDELCKMLERAARNNERKFQATESLVAWLNEHYQPYRLWSKIDPKIWFELASQNPEIEVIATTNNIRVGWDLRLEWNAPHSGSYAMITSASLRETHTTLLYEWMIASIATRFYSHASAYYEAHPSEVVSAGTGIKLGVIYDGKPGRDSLTTAYGGFANIRWPLRMAWYWDVIDLNELIFEALGLEYPEAKLPANFDALDGIKQFKVADAANERLHAYIVKIGIVKGEQLLPTLKQRRSRARGRALLVWRAACVLRCADQQLFKSVTE